MTVDVRNRQRRRVNTRQLRQFAELVSADLGGSGSSPTAPGQRRRGWSRALQLSVVLVSDREMAGLNLRYHHVAGPTDILTFDYGEGQGELIISADHAVSQARRYHTTPARELALYVVHGLLHLNGYDDRTPAQRRRMRTAERRLMAKLVPARMRSR